ncbi:MAG: DUF4340 domain-containing protein [Firmicutes bacterium]|nr:DUF4340 domain-containing protein [Candidatus Colimorpha enterica]
MSKKLRNIIIIASTFVILTVVYFAAVRPLLKAEEIEEKIPELLPGEVLGINNRIMLYEHIQKAEISSIEVFNKINHYKLYRGGDAFFFEGMETTPYDPELLSSLVVSTGYTLSMARVDLDDMSEDFSVYGLGENDDPAYFIITKLDGTAYKVFVGNRIPTGGGYYCMVENRKAVYILNTDIADTVLADVHTFLTPSLGYAVSSTTYYGVDDFMIYKNGELYVWVDMIPATETGRADGMPTFRLGHPKGFNLELTAYASMMELFSHFTGDYVVSAGLELFDGEELNVKEKYGIDIEHPYYMIHYLLDEVHTYVFFSEPDEEGGVYAYSPLFSSVSYISNISDMDSVGNFITWDSIRFISSNIVFENIKDLSEIRVEGKDENGKEVDVFFTLRTEGENMFVKLNGEGKDFDPDTLKNFKQIYGDILNISIVDYVDEGYEQNMKRLGSATVITNDGTKYEVEFFAYTTRRCYFTLNGEGYFYVTRANVEKLFNDTVRFLNGEQISSSDKS